MNDRIKLLANEVLRTDTYPASVPEMCANPEELKQPISIANGVRRYLLKQPVEIRCNEYFVDRYRWHQCAYPADYYRCCGHDNRNEFWQTCCCYTHPNDLYYWGWTHLALDYDYILRFGLKKYIERIEKAKSGFADNRFKLDLLEGMKISLTAIQERCTLYADKATEFAAAATDPDEHKKYMRMAAALRTVPMEPATSFYEAIQSVWTMFLVLPDSLGRIDQYLLPYYRADIETGKITRDDAVEMLEELFVKVHESQVDNYDLPISGHNHLVVGGYLQNGEDGYNELSELILNCIAELPTIRPQASFRYTDKTTAETIRKITELNHRNQIIVFVNDEPRIKGMISAGLLKEDALEYTVVGCNEWAICGRGKLDLAHINLLHPLSKMLGEKRSELLSATSFNDVYSLLERYLSEDIHRIVDDYTAYYEACAKDINVLSSALIDGCIERATSLTDGGAIYHGLSLSFNGISNLADSLSVIKEYVFEKKKCTMAYLLEVLDSNWEKDPQLRKEIMSSAHFFGNGDEYADSIAKNIVLSVENIRKTLRNKYLNLIVCGSFTAATHPNLIFGQMTGATPDGRLAREEYTMGIGQTAGRDRSGMAALLRSIACLDYSKFCGCIVSNLMLDPKMADTPEKLTKVSQMFHTFLKLGGMQLQINYRSAEELEEAQKHPEKYEDLLVRVTGYSGYFTLFSPDLQSDIIRRTRHDCC